MVKNYPAYHIVVSQSTTKSRPWKCKITIKESTKRRFSKRSSPFRYLIHNRISNDLYTDILLWCLEQKLEFRPYRFGNSFGIELPDQASAILLKLAWA
jgi:hypothetical protein